jgi:hypothetical protein
LDFLHFYRREENPSNRISRNPVETGQRGSKLLALPLKKLANREKRQRKQVPRQPVELQGSELDVMPVQTVLQPRSLDPKGKADREYGRESKH